MLDLDLDLDIVDADPTSAEATALLGELSATLARLTGADGNAHFATEHVTQPRSAFLIARDAATAAPLGCGSLRRFDDSTAEVKRMYARPGTRGVGRALLAALEERARRFGYRVVVLETRRANTRAVDFYLAAGYGIVSSYGPYAGRDECVCFSHAL
jgi:GNAT superfamily N-acetyltransferase